MPRAHSSRTHHRAIGRMETPVGDLVLESSAEGMRTVLLPTGSADADLLGEEAAWMARQSSDATDTPCPCADGESGRCPANRIMDRAKQALGRYFDDKGSRRKRASALNGIPLDLVAQGFIRAVLEFLPKIPPGQTMSYGQVAEQLGHIGAARAVGTACRRNPLPLFLPCHRVVAAGGKLGGFGGQARAVGLKQALLALEAT